jgi:hypothetical protein
MLASSVEDATSSRGEPGDWTIFKATDPTEGFHCETTRETPSPAEWRWENRGTYR